MSRPTDSSQLTRLVQEVLASSKYQHVYPDFIAAVAVQELGKRRNFKEALKATKNKLHQVSGVYFERREDQALWLAMLQSALQADNQPALQQVCREIMGYHASTRERLAILEQLYTTIFALLPAVTSVIDIACGLNPLAIPWMNLAPGTRYYAYDVQQDLIDFLTGYLSLLPLVEGQAHACDIVQSCPKQAVDVAFVLKTLPCLEQIEKQAGRQLLRSLNARFIVVSFPVSSLGGRNKGMAGFYEAHFSELVADTSWEVQRLEFMTELVFVVKKL
jgi:16S rRNA (guanine(1405)-N(7))-methyltransferase